MDIIISSEIEILSDSPYKSKNREERLTKIDNLFEKTLEGLQKNEIIEGQSIESALKDFSILVWSIDKIINVCVMAQYNKIIKKNFCKTIGINFVGI